MLKITYLGHASFLLEENGYSIIFDPYYDGSVPGLTFPKGLSCNEVSVSHEHKDHNAKDYVKILPSSSHISSVNFEFNHDDQNGTLRGKTTAKMVYFPSYCVCHLGDLGEDLKQKDIDKLLDADIIFVPINGFYTIGAKEAIKLKEKLPNTLFIPMHYEIKDKCIGYNDGGQIDIFRSSVDNIYEVNNTSIVIDDNIRQKSALIFNNIKQ